jgi:hypothetical protein
MIMRQYVQAAIWTLTNDDFQYVMCQVDNVILIDEPAGDSQ